MAVSVTSTRVSDSLSPAPVRIHVAEDPAAGSLLEHFKLLGVLSGNPCSNTEDLNQTQWVERFTQEISAAQNPQIATKTVILRVGTMGSGKTSSVDGFLDNLRLNHSIFPNLDLDRIVTGTKVFRDGVCNKDGTLKELSPEIGNAVYWAARRSSHVGDWGTLEVISDHLVALGYTFSRETCGSDMPHLLDQLLGKRYDIISQYINSGYEAMAVVPYLPFFVAKGRVAKRANEEGRDVPFERMCADYETFFHHLFQLMGRVSSFYLVDNNVAWGHPMRLLMETQSSGGRCSIVKTDVQALQTLLNTVIEAAASYTGSVEEHIYQIEVAFLNAMVQNPKRSICPS